MYLADSMRSQTTYVILGLLSVEGRQSGYDMRKTIQGSVGYFWGESYGQIYPALKRLAGEGLIVAAGHAAMGRAAKGRAAKGRAGRQEYSLTAAGHARLREWLAVPYREDPPRDEFLLKLFFGREAGPEVAERQVREFQERNRRLLAALEDIRRVAARNAQHPHFRFWMLTLEYGLAQIHTALRWSDEALEALSLIEPDSRKKKKGTNGRTRRRR
jgi:PadR family transcriptional regulator AphA